MASNSWRVQVLAGLVNIEREPHGARLTYLRRVLKHGGYSWDDLLSPKIAPWLRERVIELLGPVAAGAQSDAMSAIRNARSLLLTNGLDWPQAIIRKGERSAKPKPRGRARA